LLAPHSDEFRRRLRRRQADGTVVVRSIRPDDASALQAFHRHLSDETVRNRFFGCHPELTGQEAHRFTALVSTS
jgi:predicted RNA polymerase sigma factor